MPTVPKLKQPKRPPSKKTSVFKASQVISEVVVNRAAPDEEITDRLSNRELEVLEMIGAGKEIKAIATALNLSPKTVETHRTHIKEKLNLQNARQVARFAVQWVAERGV